MPVRGGHISRAYRDGHNDEPVLKVAGKALLPTKRASSVHRRWTFIKVLCLFRILNVRDIVNLADADKLQVSNFVVKKIYALYYN